jgi:SAM-dependent methyltransferase
MRQAWDLISTEYLSRQGRTTDDIVFGPLAPPERELRLLGDLRGLRVLDLGCGGGQTTIAMARQGAQVTGVDSSGEQLYHARALVAAEGEGADLKIDFVQADMAKLEGVADEAWDVVFSAFALPYVAQPRPCLVEWRRVLRVGGRLLISMDHPLRDCFWDTDEEELSSFPVRSYFDRTPWEWQFPNTEVYLRSHRYTVGDWVDLVQEAGFGRVRVVEPPTPVEMLDELWPQDSALAPLRHLPQTLILMAERM